jgi:ABC-type polar amino acid transport system ATPase subunit
VALRSQVGMIFQQFHLWPHMTVLGNVIEAPIRVARTSRAVAVADGLRFLAQVGLADRAQDYPSQLSGGQQQRVAIARALAMRPVSILFDEPTSALDPKLASEVLATMSGLAAQNVTMLVVTHEMSFARRVATRIVYMSAGRIVHDCPTREFFEDQRDPEVQAFLSHG